MTKKRPKNVAGTQQGGIIIDVKCKGGIHEFSGELPLRDRFGDFKGLVGNDAA